MRLLTVGVLTTLVACRTPRSAPPDAVTELEVGRALDAGVSIQKTPALEWQLVGELAPADRIGCHGLIADGDDVLSLQSIGDDEHPSFELRSTATPARVLARWPRLTEGCSVAANAGGYYVLEGGVALPSGWHSSLFHVARDGTVKLLRAPKQHWTHLAVDDHALYTVQEHTKVVQIDASGRTRIVGTLPARMEAVALASAGSHIVTILCHAFAEEEPCAVHTIAKKGGKGQTLFELEGPFQLAGDDAALFVATPTHVVRFDWASSTKKKLAEGLGDLQALAFSTSRGSPQLYVHASGALYAVDDDGAAQRLTEAPTSLAEIPSGVHSMLATKTYLYVAGSKIVRAPRTSVQRTPPPP